MSSLDNLVNSQRVYSQQIQKDVFTSNVGVNIDPVAVYPKPENNAIPSTFFQSRFEVRQSGNLVAEDDLSDLNLANLTVGGEIRVPIVKTDDIILNGGSLDVLLQGVLTTPLQVNIDANNKNILGASNIGATQVDTSRVVGVTAATTTGPQGLLSIIPSGQAVTGNFTAQQLQVGNAQRPGNVIIETGGCDADNTAPGASNIGRLDLRINQLDPQLVAQAQYLINIGSEMGAANSGGGAKSQIIQIGTAPTSTSTNTSSVTIGNSTGTLGFFQSNRVISIADGGGSGTTPTALAANGLDKATIDAATGTAAGNAAAIADITEILRK